MSKIDHILGASTFEIVRAKIASILSVELANQIVLNQAVINDGVSTPEEKAASQFNIDSIPSKVWEERFRSPIPQDYPLLNVVFIEAPLNESTGHSRQIGIDRFQVECYQHAKKTTEKWGDELASIKLHRLLGICRKILMDRNYYNLELPEMIGWRNVQNITIGQPDEGTNDAYSTIFGKFDVLVKTEECVDDLTGDALLESITELRLYETNKGYSWQVNS